MVTQPTASLFLKDCCCSCCPSDCLPTFEVGVPRMMRFAHDVSNPLGDDDERVRGLFLNEHHATWSGGMRWERGESESEKLLERSAGQAPEIGNDESRIFPGSSLVLSRQMDLTPDQSGRFLLPPPLPAVPGFPLSYLPR